LLGFFVGQENVGAYIITFVGFCLVLASYICFVVLLKRLAEYVKRYKLAKKADGLLIMLGVMTAGFLLAFLGGMVGGEAQGPNNAAGGGSALGLALLIFGCLIVVVVFILSIFRYLRVIHEVRDAL
jgi:hypothetical protein